MRGVLPYRALPRCGKPVLGCASGCLARKTLKSAAAARSYRLILRETSLDTQLPEPRQHPHDPARSPYSSPILIFYGAVAKLTASGTGSAKETSQAGQPVKKP